MKIVYLVYNLPEVKYIMFEIDKNKFGEFISELRKEKSLTQKELAQRLFISDKAVSKWERGLSMPDIALLKPLAFILGVTVTELLEGKRIENTNELNVEHVEALLNTTIMLSEQEQAAIQGDSKKAKLQRLLILLACVMIVGIEAALFYVLGYTKDQLVFNLLTVELLCLIFGAYSMLFAKEKLPMYYDENKINVFSDGFFRMNIPGVYFNNSNWGHIIKTLRIWNMATFVVYPLLYLIGSQFFPSLWDAGYLFIMLSCVFSMFIPIYVIGKKYQ